MVVLVQESQDEEREGVDIHSDEDQYKNVNCEPELVTEEQVFQNMPVCLVNQAFVADVCTELGKTKSSVDDCGKARRTRLLAFGLGLAGRNDVEEDVHCNAM